MGTYLKGTSSLSNEPRIKARPVRRAPTFPSATTSSLKPPTVTTTPSKRVGAKLVDSISDKGSKLPAGKSPSKANKAPTHSSGASSATKTPHTPKKSQAEVEQAQREQYATTLFAELNRVLFKDGLPKETKLIWSKRLLTTAGRAKWHRSVNSMATQTFRFVLIIRRSRDGVQTTEIALATKILDSEGLYCLERRSINALPIVAERIRNTLSHEMCHLASWIISGDPKEGHGKIWKAWCDSFW